MEMSWRDPVANIQIEKRRLALVPGDCSHCWTMKNALTGDVRLHGLPGMDRHGPRIACVVEATDVFGLAIRLPDAPSIGCR